MSAIYRKVNGEWRQATSGQIYNGASWQSKTIDETISYIQGKLIDNGEHYNKFTLSYDLNGGTGTLSGQTVYSTAKAHAFVIPSTPNISREHYDFVRWLDQDGNNLQAHNQLISTIDNKDSTAIAQWLAQYHITYNVNAPSGTSPSLSKTEEYVSALNNATTVLPNPSMANYKFLGWYTDPNDKGSWVASGGATYKPTQSINLYAQWVKVYTITYWKSATINAYAAVLYPILTNTGGPTDKLISQITYPSGLESHFSASSFNDNWHKNFETDEDLDESHGDWAKYNYGKTQSSTIIVPEGTTIKITLQNNYNNGGRVCRFYSGTCKYGDADQNAQQIASGNPVSYTYTINKDQTFLANWRTEGSRIENIFTGEVISDTRDSWWAVYNYE